MFSPWINTTNKCNLNCEYCYIKRNSEVMGKKVYDAMLNSFPFETHMRISGGEPLLVYDMWKEWAKKWYYTEVLTNLRIVPNGYFEQSYHTSVSVDGYGEKPLDKEIIQNISKLKEPWIMTTISKDLTNLPLLAEYVLENNYRWALSTNYWWNGIPSAEDLILVLNDVISILKSGDYNLRRFMFNNVNLEDIGGCDAGNEMVAVDCDGSIFACQTLCGGKDKLGDVWNGYTKVKFESKCPENCNAKGMCTGWCPLYHEPNDICTVIKFVITEVFDYA